MSTIEVIYLASSILICSVGFLILFINPWRTINQAYAIAATLSSLWLLSIYFSIARGLHGSAEQILFWLKASNGLGSFFPWACRLVQIATTQTGSLVQAIKISWRWVITAGALALLVHLDGYFYSPSEILALQKRGIAHTIHIAALGVLCILILNDALRKLRECTGVRQLEMKFFVINMCLSALVAMGSAVASQLFKVSALRYAGPFVIVGCFSLTTWAICYHRVFDARQVFVALGRLLSTLSVLAGSALFFHFYLSRFLGETLNLLISACLGGVLAAYWDTKIRYWMDIDSRRKVVARAQITDWAREEADSAKLVLKFEAFLRDWCQSTSVTFHTYDINEPLNRVLRTSNYAEEFKMVRELGYTTKETLDRRRPDFEVQRCRALLSERDLGAIVVAPRGSHSPSCLVALGHKHSLRPYTHPDMQLLIELVELMDNILTHSRAAARAAQIEKMESAAMMSRGLAHDLNNLATPVSTFLLHMENRVAPDTPEAEVLADAKHSIRVMQDYIRESLFFARRLVPNFESLSTKDLFTTTIQVIQHRAQARNVIVVVAGEDDVRFTADRVLLQRLLQNLVLNAIDASPRGGTVSLSAAVDGNERVVLTVVDDGQGIPAEIKDRIFEPYFTTKDTGYEVRGMGLGLAICLKISDLHGGTLNATNTSSGGAVFTVALPIHPRAHANSSDSKHSLQSSIPTSAEITNDPSPAARCRPPSPI